MFSTNRQLKRTTLSDARSWGMCHILDQWILSNGAASAADNLNNSILGMLTLILCSLFPICYCVPISMEHTVLLQTKYNHVIIIIQRAKYFIAGKQSCHLHTQSYSSYTGKQPLKAFLARKWPHCKICIASQLNMEQTLLDLSLGFTSLNACTDIPC